MQNLCTAGSVAFRVPITHMSSPGKVLASHRIKPRAPLLVRVPANSLGFQPCGRILQAGYLCVSLGTEGHPPTKGHPPNA